MPVDIRANQISAALRQISRGFTELADAISEDPDDKPEDERYRNLIAEWGERGLDRPEAVALFRKHGFAPQAAGGWARGNWLELRPDGRRYLTTRSLDWLNEQETRHD